MASIQRIKLNQADGTVIVPSEWFVAKITEVGTTTTGSGSCVGYAHAWIEQQICLNGYDYEDMPASKARVGTLVNQPAFALDGSQATVGNIVLARYRSIDSTGQTIYEFFKGGSGGGNTMDCPHVSSVQCTGGLLIVTYDTTCVAP
jgi:hypothetical protein